MCLTISANTDDGQRWYVAAAIPEGAAEIHSQSMVGGGLVESLRDCLMRLEDDLGDAVFRRTGKFVASMRPMAAHIRSVVEALRKRGFPTGVSLMVTHKGDVIGYRIDDGATVSDEIIAELATKLGIPIDEVAGDVH